MENTLHIQHIVDNFDIYGFSDIENSFVQAIKEMVENSLDAIRSVPSDRARNIELTVRHHPSTMQDMACVEISDNGVGMQDPRLLLHVFSTTKRDAGMGGSSESTERTTGKFGVGLSCVLLYSCLNCSRTVPMRINSTVENQTLTVTTDFAINPSTGRPMIVQRQEMKNSSQQSGTNIRVFLPLKEPSSKPSAPVILETLEQSKLKRRRSTSDIAQLLQRVWDITALYVSRLHVLPYNTVSVNMALETDEFRQEYTFPAPATVTAEIAKSNEEAYTSLLHDRISAVLDQRKQSVRYVAASKRTLEYETGSGDKIEIQAYVSAALVFEVPDNVRDMEEDEDEYGGLLERDFEALNIADILDDPSNVANSIPVRPSDDMCLHLQLWRYANGSPLMDRSDDALSCAISSCLKSFKWKNYGFKLHHDCSGGGRSSSRGSKGIRSHIYDENEIGDAVREPQWRLRSNRGYELNDGGSAIWANPTMQRPTNILFLVDVHTQSAPFASTTKTALRQDPHLIKVVNQGMCDVMESLRAQAHDLELFQSQAEIKEAAIKKIAIPTLAAAIAKIIQRSPCPKFQQRCLYLMGRQQQRLDDTVLIPHLHSKISVLLQQIN